MKISTILDHIDSGHIALPEFQRGYVWNRDQVRGLMDSLYRRHPVGSLLVWVTKSESAEFRGEGTLSPGVVKLLLDGQQRITSLYGIIRGKAPEFFDGNSKAFTGLYFHMDREDFSFFSPVKMKDDPLWIDVSELMIKGNDGLGGYIAQLNSDPDLVSRVGDFVSRLNKILGIFDIDFHVEEVTGIDKTIDIVVDIFNRVNSGGTKLSQGDLALAKICAEWTAGRVKMKNALERWQNSDYNFNLDWLLRSVNTILTGEAKFLFLHDVNSELIRDGLKRAEKSIDYLLNAVSGRLGLDHDRVLFGRYAFPVMSHYIDRRGGKLDEIERDKLLFWYLQSAMWGRYSGSTESIIDQDLKHIEEIDGGLDRLIEQLRLWRGGLSVEPGHFSGWSLGARFYPVLYLLTRIGAALDWGNGLPLKNQLLGKTSTLEVHHIFPRKILYSQKYTRPQVNAVANYCLLTKDTNLQISAKPPYEYFYEIQDKFPGALESQWIPMDQDLWKTESYLDFLQARKELLAEATNTFLSELLHEEIQEIEIKRPEKEIRIELKTIPKKESLGGVDSEHEEEELIALNSWIEKQGLPKGSFLHELADQNTGEPVAILDLAWPNGLQEELSTPVAVLINEGPEVLELANEYGYRYFTDIQKFKQYVLGTVINAG